MSIKPDDNKIDEAVIQCADAIEEGGLFPRLSYEEGVQAALKWVLGRGEHPLDD